MSLLLIEEMMVEQCDLVEVHAEQGKPYGPSAARWRASHIGRHSANLCDKCAREWRLSWIENGGSVEVRKRDKSMVRKRNVKVDR